ncbi:MAG: flagellar protein FlhE [Pseudomonadota bacterium]
MICFKNASPKNVSFKIGWLAVGPTPARLLKSIAMVALCVVSGSVYAATGSWSTEVPSVFVTMSDRAISSQPIEPPTEAQVEGAVIGRIHWRFQMPANTPVNAWLCHPEQCVPLTAMRGMTSALAGKQVDGPLHFRFSLAPGQRPVRVQKLQVIVNYQ